MLKGAKRKINSLPSLVGENMAVKTDKAKVKRTKT